MHTNVALRYIEKLEWPGDKAIHFLPSLIILEAFLFHTIGVNHYDALYHLE